MDKLAQMAYQDQTLVNLYKEVAEVPLLEMVDDVLTVSKCSATAVAMNATVNAFMEKKRK